MNQLCLLDLIDTAPAPEPERPQGYPADPPSVDTLFVCPQPFHARYDTEAATQFITIYSQQGRRDFAVGFEHHSRGSMGGYDLFIRELGKEAWEKLGSWSAETKTWRLECCHWDFRKLAEECTRTRCWHNRQLSELQGKYVVALRYQKERM